MRMIAEALIEALEAGLREEGQRVVSMPAVANLYQEMQN
jgi:hypothetical protein